MIEKDGKYYLVKDSKKSPNPATYKQYKYLEMFKNVDVTINTSQFIKYVDRSEASEAIELAKSGEDIVVE